MAADHSPGVCICVLAIQTALFPDDVITTCADCGVGIRHRPYCPAELEKVCIRCGHERVGEQMALGRPINVAATPQTRREVIDYFAKRRN